MKAADISDDQVFAVIDSVRADKKRWTFIEDVAATLPSFPFKVVMAKCHQMIRKGRISGCPCGCRGDLERIQAKS